MKRLSLFIALLIFAFSYGQTYEDIISIDSKEQFIRIGVENDYEVVKKNEDIVELAIQPSKNKNGDDVGFGFGTYSNNESAWIVRFSFLRNNIFEKQKYDKIFSFVKGNLKFEKVAGNANYYTLDENRSIGFYIKDGWCNVLLITNNQ